MPLCCSSETTAQTSGDCCVRHAASNISLHSPLSASQTLHSACVTVSCSVRPQWLKDMMRPDLSQFPPTFLPLPHIHTYTRWGVFPPQSYHFPCDWQIAHFKALINFIGWIFQIRFNCMFLKCPYILRNGFLRPVSARPSTVHAHTHTSNSEFKLWIHWEQPLKMSTWRGAGQTIGCGSLTALRNG